MKYMTKRNIEKVTSIIVRKGYDRITAENMAINCFCMVQHFDIPIEVCIERIEDTYKHGMAIS